MYKFNKLGGFAFVLVKATTCSDRCSTAIANRHKFYGINCSLCGVFAYIESSLAHNATLLCIGFTFTNSTTFDIVKLNYI